ncbi:hypothetical protein NQZ68_004767 [Scomber scombrus]|uniref:Uncharacterized protein n=1 Tax=Scomber scombrus TaxID=13677 RepID=A0AAV1Q2H2_SCOSC
MEQADVYVVYMTYLNSVKAPGEIKAGSDSSLDSVQRLHFTSPLQGQHVAAWTAEVKRLSAPQHKQLMFPNNQGLVGGFQCRHERVREDDETVPISSSFSSCQSSKWKPSIVTFADANLFSCRSY